MDAGGDADAAGAVRAGFVEMQALAKKWMEKEREGISLIESFQMALLATREAAGVSGEPARNDRVMAEFTASSIDAAGNMDPWLAEDQFIQIKELRAAFYGLLERMYTISVDTSATTPFDEDVKHERSECVLACSDYTQFIGSELANFEAEFQHIEVLLGMVSFDITIDQLRTLVISWSTSPFLDPARSQEFRQRHEQSQKLRH